jgi:DNA-binding NarL/FixJ family response regulator
VHYIFSIEASDAGVHLILSFKRFSHPFCDREAVLVQTLHHSFLSSDEGPSRTTLGDLLSVRKTQVLTHLLSGKSEKEIATELRISPHTVHVHVKWLYRKYAVNSRAALISRSLLSASDALDEPKLSSMSRADKKSELIAGSPA